MGFFKFISDNLRKIKSSKIKIRPKLEEKKIKSDATTQKTGEDISIRVLHISPNAYLVNKASRLTIGKEEFNSYEDRLKHIEKLMKMGHESILEHSNIVSLISIPIDRICSMGISQVYDLIELLNRSRYLHIANTNNAGRINLLIGGSIRGYMNTIRESKNDNSLAYIFKEILYSSTEKEFLNRLITRDLIEESKCVYRYPVELEMTENEEELVNKDPIDPEPILGEHVDLIYKTNPNTIFKEIHQYGFSYRDACRVSTITFLFHDISRAIGNQLVRHRVGITQESQRYCTHGLDIDKDFIDPIKMHNGDIRYLDLDKDRIHANIKDPFYNYQYLLDNKISKEDARYWLPLGVTTKILMTFTYRQYAQFLNLRLDLHAQREIRHLAAKTVELKDGKFNHEELYSNFIDPLIEYESKIDLHQKIKVDDDLDNINTQEIFTQDNSKEEEIKSLEINSIEDAEKYLRANEEMKNL